MHYQYLSLIDGSQKMVNDFNTVDYKKIKYSKLVEDLIITSHTDSQNLKIDFPHLMKPIAISYDSVWWKESIKIIITFPQNKICNGLFINLLRISPKKYFSD